MRCKSAERSAPRPWLTRLKLEYKWRNVDEDIDDPEYLAIYRDILAKMLTNDANPEPVKIRLLGETNRVGGRKKKRR